ncbi:MAG: hypothetical protein QNJ46_20320 [Leptolyngbyaceae cyanobacterium MO_188.B28]|nr:hypothetical protein [Leptolyngbyaceae cyanobacterium MO_188.B28]
MTQFPRRLSVRRQTTNRVAGGAPSAPTPPGVRVHTGRFSPKEQT